MAFSQGYFRPRYPEKYKGDIKKIRYLSSWELKFDQFLDNNPNILEWSSEPFAIPYIKPTTKQVHRYFPDYWVKYKTKSGEIVQEVLEIKPLREKKQAVFLIENNFSSLPPIRSRNPKTRLHEQVTMLINAAKWKAAVIFCHKYGMRFRILTEKELFS